MSIVIHEQANQEQLLALVRTLVDKIQSGTVSDYSLLSGRAGELLFVYQAAKYADDLVDLNWLSEEINQLIVNAKAVLPDFSIAYGLAGVAWFYQYILQDQQETDDENVDIDTLFADVLATVPWQGEFEYVLGLVGYAPYLSRRIHTPSGKQNALALIEHFSRLAVVGTGTAYWPTLANSAFRMEKVTTFAVEVNLGLAHGHTGVLAALLALSKNDVVAAAAKSLLQAGCDYLVEQQQNVSIGRSHFSTLSNTLGQSRLGWCYGDLTIALTLARAGKLLQRLDYVELARTIALHAAGRDVVSAKIYDSGICHGSSGLALIFGLLFTELGAPELQQAAQRWQCFYLEQYQQYGLVGLQKWAGDIEPGDRQKKSEVSGLLEGYSGIGLAALAGLGQEPDWVDALLLA